MLALYWKLDQQASTTFIKYYRMTRTYARSPEHTRTVCSGYWANRIWTCLSNSQNVRPAQGSISPNSHHDTQLQWPEEIDLSRLHQDFDWWKSIRGPTSRGPWVWTSTIPERIWFEGKQRHLTNLRTRPSGVVKSWQLLSQPFVTPVQSVQRYSFKGDWERQDEETLYGPELQDVTWVEGWTKADIKVSKGEIQTWEHWEWLHTFCWAEIDFTIYPLKVRITWGRWRVFLHSNNLFCWQPCTQEAFDTAHRETVPTKESNTKFSHQQAFTPEALCQTPRGFYPRFPLNIFKTHYFTPATFDTTKHLQKMLFTPQAVCSNNLLHQKPYTPEQNFYTKKFDRQTFFEAKVMRMKATR